MRKTIFAISVVLCVLFCSNLQFAQTPAKEKAPEVKDLDGFYFGYEEFTGGIDPQSRGQKITQVVSDFQAQHIDLYQPSLVVYFNSPKEVKAENVKWAFGFVVAKGTPATPPVKVMEFKKQKAVFYYHKGPYSELPKIQEKMREFIKKKGYKVVYPYYNKYLNNPQMTAPELLETQLVIPIQSK
jgi:effector-binding domain-containing protein